MIPIGLFILWVATRQKAAPLFLYAIVGGNLLWVIESTIVAGNTAGIAAAGSLFVVGQAVAVAVVTLLEIVGLVRSRSAASAAI